LPKREDPYIATRSLIWIHFFFLQWEDPYIALMHHPITLEFLLEKRIFSHKANNFRHVDFVDSYCIVVFVMQSFFLHQILSHSIFLLEFLTRERLFLFFIFCFGLVPPSFFYFNFFYLFILFYSLRPKLIESFIHFTHFSRFGCFAAFLCCIVFALVLFLFG